MDPSFPSYDQQGAGNSNFDSNFDSNLNSNFNSNFNGQQQQFSNPSFTASFDQQPQYQYQEPTKVPEVAFNPLQPPMGNADSKPSSSGPTLGQFGQTGLPGQMGGEALDFNNLVNQVSSNPMASMGLQYGQALVTQNFGGLYKWLGGDSLRFYFQVDNVYVLTKLKLLLVPCLHKDWSRRRAEGMQSMQQNTPDAVRQYATPRHDVNAPDLYIPSMSFLTFTLLMGYVLGTFGQFTPEVLGMTASSIFFVLVVEILLLKMGFYLIGTNISSPKLLDLAAYCSYKYVPMTLMTLACLLLGSTVFYGSILVLGLSIAMFMMKTLRREIDDSCAAQGQPRDTGVKTNYFLFTMGVLQILFSWFLVRTANNAPSLVTGATPLSAVPPIS